eukprot:2173-Heterococcus_DN1.PRE.2
MHTTVSLQPTSQWPVFADIASGLRCWDSTLNISCYDQILLSPLVTAGLVPDVILQIGQPLISKRLTQFMSSSAATVHTAVLVSTESNRHDPAMCFTHRLTCSTSAFVQAIDSSNSSTVDAAVNTVLYSSALSTVLQRLNAAASSAISTTLSTQWQDVLTEPYIAYSIAQQIPAAAGLFLSNSMPCRDMDAYAYNTTTATGNDTDTAATTVTAVTSSGNRLHSVGINRGASGIDGVLSSAIGYAVGLRAPVTLVIGDMAMLHDINALHLLKQIPYAVTIVCVNNGGSGIFSFLPIAQHSDVFTPYFDTPHSTSFKGVCSSFGVPYVKATTAEQFAAAYTASQQQPLEQPLDNGESHPAMTRHSFIEAVTTTASTGMDNVQVHRTIGKAVTAAVQTVVAADVKLSW